MHIRKDDQVEVITGDDKGTPDQRRFAKVLRVLTSKNKIVVVDAHVNEDTATVEVTVGDGGHGTIELVWQDNHWRFKVGGSLSPEAQDAYKTMCK